MPPSEVATPATPAMSSRFQWDWAALNPFGDMRVRYGIKMGLAMLLALWIAQVLRLPYPNWSILAVLVLMNAHFVGAIANKALMRALGTVVGALLGVWVIGDFANTPWAFLFWAFVVLNTEARAYVGEAVDARRVVDLRVVFGRQVMGLRTLLQTGGRGSAYFKARLGNYQRFLVSLTHLFQAVLELQRRRAEETALLELVRTELENVISAVDAELGILSASSWHGHALPPTSLNAAFAPHETKVKELRDEGTFRNASPAAGEAFFGHFATLRLDLQHFRSAVPECRRHR